MDASRLSHLALGEGIFVRQNTAGVIFAAKTNTYGTSRYGRKTNKQYTFDVLLFLFVTVRL